MATMKKAMVKKAMVKKAQAGKKQKMAPTYKNLNMGVRNEQYEMTGQYKDVTPTALDSANYRRGYERGLKGGKEYPNERNVEKMGRWEGQNANKPKKKGKMGMKVKKAQPGTTQKKGVVEPDGGIGSAILSKIPEAGTMKKTKTKERSADGNYMAKTVTRETPQGKSSKTKTRRTIQGILRGAPSVQQYKKGGMAKKSKKK